MSQKAGILNYARAGWRECRRDDEGWGCSARAEMLDLLDRAGFGERIDRGVVTLNTAATATATTPSLSTRDTGRRADCTMAWENSHGKGDVTSERERGQIVGSDAKQPASGVLHQRKPM